MKRGQTNSSKQSSGKKQQKNLSQTMDQQQPKSLVNKLAHIMKETKSSAARKDGYNI
jgi:hypothetical protein